MGKKDDLIAEATSLGIDLDSNETIAVLEAKIAAHKAGPGAGETISGAPEGGTLTRRKINRGSTRRITRALEKFGKDMDAFIGEIDLQAYVVDENGERMGEAPLVKALRNMKAGVTHEVNGILGLNDAPAAEGE